MPIAPDDRSPTHADAVLDGVRTELATWRAAHPTATFAAIEAAVEPLVARVRTQLIREALAPVPSAADPPPRPACARCGMGMVARGHHRRTLQIVGDAAVTLHRQYWSCPQCGDGVFPPG